ncbi:MAG: alkaline phosphatase D family protein [Dehalococcoidia bacterium]
MRRLAALTLLAAVALAVACGGDGDKTSGPVSFTHGVASGDVTPDGAVLWTRVDHEATLTAEVSADATFGDIVADTKAEATAERDFTAQAAVDGLEPATQYYYRFRSGDNVSTPGSFRTAPADGANAPVRFIFSGDSDGTAGEDGSRAFDFGVLDTARDEDADFFLYFGDTIYADSGYGPKATTLDDFRAKYKENRLIQPLASILAATSIYTTWDDHEVENDYAGKTVDPELFAAGLAAYREYWPIRGDDPGILYRRFHWGKAVDIIILDERSFRDPDVAAECAPAGGSADVLPGLGIPGAPEEYKDLRVAVGLPAETDPACLAALNDPGRTLLGAEQKQFLLDALESSEATFKIVVNPLPIQEIVAQPYDRWEGYRAERDEIVKFIGDNNIENVIFLTTDFHANFIGDVRLNLASPAVAVEAIAGPIAHETLGDAIVRDRGEAVLPVYEQLLKQIPRVDCAVFDAYSYGLVEIDPTDESATITLKDESGETLCSTVVQAS